jgi:hypothetical protein
MAPVAEADAQDERPEGGQEGVRCDFCGATVPRVRRVALDGEYDRLRKPHRVRYACPTCSEAKERERRSGASG